jgi:hypothetical protein
MLIATVEFVEVQGKPVPDFMVPVNPLQLTITYLHVDPFFK